MNRYSLFWGILFLHFICFFETVFAQNSKAKEYILIVIDQENKSPLSTALAVVKKQRFKSDLAGKIYLPHTLNPKDTLLVYALGYETQRVPVYELQSHQPFHLSLTAPTNFLGEATIEGKKVLHTQNAVVASIDESQIRQQLGNTFAASLMQTQGVNMIQTGATIAKPMLHGMYGNRLLLINNGVRQQGQQWGADHAPELDVNTGQSVQVVKGAEGVRYGSDALGGVIAVESYPLPYGHSHVHGNLSTLYGTNGKRWANTGYLTWSKTIKENLFALRLQGTYINSGDRSTADYLLNNTGMREGNYSLAMGWKRKAFNLEGYYSFFSTKLGVLYAAQMGDIDQLKQRILWGRPPVTTAWQRSINYPFQDVKHHIAKLKGSYAFAEGTFNLQVAYQRDERQEFHQRRNNRSHIPSLDLTLQNVQTDLNYKKYYAHHWSTETGLFYNHTYNANKGGTGVVPIIPNYVQNTAGIYAIQQYSGKTWGGELGARLDKEFLWAKGYDTYQQLYGQKTKYHNFTYTLGVHYHLLPSLTLLSNVGMAWRAPHVHELYSNGVEQGAGMYVKGSTDLKSEKSTKWITSVKFELPKIKAEASVYWQWINNFIYDEPLPGATKVAISGVYPVFQYKSTDALFRGIDLDFNYTPTSWLTYKLGGSAIWANERKTNQYLPYIPTHRLKQSLVLTWNNIQHFHPISFGINHQWVAKQNRFNPHSDLIPFSPAAYQLWGLDCGVTWVMKNEQKIKAHLAIDNLFNSLYKEYTNRFRYYAHDLGRDIRFLITYEF